MELAERLEPGLGKREGRRLARVGSLRVVADARELAAALLRPAGHPALALARDDLEFHAPAFLLEALDERLDEHASEARRSRAAMRGRVEALASRLLPVPLDGRRGAARRLPRAGDAVLPPAP